MIKFHISEYYGIDLSDYSYGFVNYEDILLTWSYWNTTPVDRLIRPF